MVASLIAAFMSTISTHLNWGSSYIVNDFYKRFLYPNASQKRLVLVGKVSTVFLVIVAALFALTLNNAYQAFQILLQIGAGTGLIFIMRWFWYRINAYSEITAMIVSFVIAVYFQIIHQYTGLPEIGPGWQLLAGVLITSVFWITVTLLTKPADKETLYNFYKIIRPGGPGWKKVIQDAQKENIKLEPKSPGKWDVPTGIICMILGCLLIYSLLFTTGYWIYGNYNWAMVSTITAVLSGYLLFRMWGKLNLSTKTAKTI